MRRALTSATLFYFSVALVAASAFAEPPVPGRHCDVGGTFQGRSFSNSITTTAPDIVNNPHGQAVLQVEANYGWYQSTGWLTPSLSLGQGVWALSGEIDVRIANKPVRNPFTEGRIDVVWKLPLPDESLVANTPSASGTSNNCAVDFGQPLRAASKTAQPLIRQGQLPG